MRYRGICVGGVADGLHQERDDPRMTVSKMRRDPSGANTDHVIGRSDYKFLLLLGTTNMEIGCWALEGMAIEQVIARLVRGYNPHGLPMIGGIQ